jgi:hypothetical protein
MIPGQVNDDGEFCIYKYVCDILSENENYKKIIENIKSEADGFVIRPKVYNEETVFISESCALLYLCKYLFSNDVVFNTYIVYNLKKPLIKYELNVDSFKKWYSSLSEEMVCKCIEHSYYMNIMLSFYLYNFGPLHKTDNQSHV